jgi:Fe-S-cluster containining protein
MEMGYCLEGPAFWVKEELITKPIINPRAFRTLDRIMRTYGNKRVGISVASNYFSLYLLLEPSDYLIFECQRTCAPKCCSTFVLVFPSDVERIANFLKISKKDVLKKHCALDEDDVAFRLRRRGRMCTFLQLKEMYTCSIYEARPMVCALFPLSVQKVRSEGYVRVWYCEGVGMGKKVSISSILNSKSVRNHLDEVDEWRRLEKLIPNENIQSPLDRSLKIRRILKEWYLGT